MGIIGTILVGFIVGLLARFFFPGTVPLGFWLTVALGIGGGPLIVALILGRLRRTGPISWVMPLPANIVLRNFGLTLDVGHLVCTGETPVGAHIRRWQDWLWNVHIEDMRKGVHDHLMFGEGEIDFPPILQAFRDIGYSGGLHVELSRHSHVGPEAAKRAYDFLSVMGPI